MIIHSSIEPIYYLLPLLGLIIGLFGTMLGGGGGFFFLPILTLVVEVPAQTAVITSLAATLPICIVGTLGHYRKGNINFRIGFMFATAGLVGAFIGAGITSRISAEQLKVSFGIYSVLIALNMLVSTWRKKQAEANGTEKQIDSGIIQIGKGSFFGFFAGTITGTFGTSGTAPVLAGLFTMRIPLKLVIGTSLMVVLVNTVFAVGAHFLVGQIDLTLVCFLTAGSIIGALLGPRVLSKVKIEKSENNIRYWFAAVIVVIGVLMIFG
ncbi:MAG: sulfite exporter TauE/SafE family protein [Bacteroidetes bacterium]|nr:sulfite exporter TauE/SafE family protein [Bacteroidota bacterium]